MPLAEHSDDGEWADPFPPYPSVSSSTRPTTLDAPQPCTARISNGEVTLGLYSALTPRPSTSSPQTGPCSLQGLCLGVLGLHVIQYIEQLGPHALAWLPVDMKAALVAVARRRRTLHDEVLLALADEAFTALDLWGCGTLLGDDAIRTAVCSMPNLQALDITGCVNVTPKTLRAIAAACPCLKLLRLGVPAVEQAASAAMADILPRIGAVSEADVEEHWEALIEPGPHLGGPDCCAGPATAPATAVADMAAVADAAAVAETTAAASRATADGAAAAALSVPSPSGRGATALPSAAAAAAFGRGRLSALRWLVWPGAPSEVVQLVASQCPKVQVNPMPAAVARAVARAGAPSPAASASAAQPGSVGAGASGQAAAGGQAAAATSARAAASGAGAGVAKRAGGGGGWQAASDSAAPSGPPWDPLDPMCALDEPLVAMVGPSAWRGLHSGSASATPQAAGCKSVAERFRQAYMEQAQRLKDKAHKEEAALRRRQLRTSTVLRAFARWLDDGGGVL